MDEWDLVQLAFSVVFLPLYLLPEFRSLLFNNALVDLKRDIYGEEKMSTLGLGNYYLNDGVSLE